MSVVMNIRAGLVDLRKRKSDLVPFVSLVVSEIESVGKNNGNRKTTDAEAVKVLQKTDQKLTETIDLLESNGKEVPEDLKRQAAYIAVLIDSHAPKQLDNDFISDKIDELLKSGHNLGEIMKFFKSNYDGQYDGKLVSAIIKIRTA